MFFPKILGNFVYTHMFKYCNEINILYTHQYGFMANHLSSMVLIQLFVNISKVLDNKEITLRVFADFFVGIWYNQSVIAETSYLWFRKNWFVVVQWLFISRKARIMHHLLISCGIPQGSILAPLLFLVDFNDWYMTS